MLSTGERPRTVRRHPQWAGGHRRLHGVERDRHQNWFEELKRLVPK
jgi:hypothetical protein